MKQLTHPQRIAHRTRLQDIIDYCRVIEKLTQRMKKDDSYINAQYLQCLNDDAGSIKDIVTEIEERVIEKTKVS